MPSILVATGFVRIDSDTKPALKALKALGAAGSTALSTALLPATAAVSAGLATVAASAAAAGGAMAVYGAAVKPQFADITKAMQQQSVAEDSRTKAAVNASLAQDLAAKSGFKYGKQVEITKDMTEDAKIRAQEYNTALSASKSSSNTATKAQALYKSQLEGMPPATRKTTEALARLKETNTEWSRSLASTTMPVFTKGIDFLRNLLPKLTPIVKSVAKEIDGFVSHLGEGSAGKIFKEFGANVTKSGAGALRNFLEVGKNLTAGIIGILNAFMPLSAGVTGGLQEMSEKFANWSADLGKSQGFNTFIQTAKDAAPLLAGVFQDVARALGAINDAAGPLAGIGLKMLSIFAQLVAAIPTPVLQILVPTIIAVNLAMKAWAIYQSIAAAATWLFAESVIASNGAVASSRFALILFRIQAIAYAVATGIMTVATSIATAATWALGAAIAFVTSPIGIVVIAIGLLVAAFVILWKKSDAFRNFWKMIWEGIKTAALAVKDWFAGPFLNFFTKTIPAAFQTVLDWVKKNWPWIIGGLGGPIGLAVVWIIKNWDKVTKFFSSSWNWLKDNVLYPIGRFFTSTIPGWAGMLRDLVLKFWRGLLTGLVNAYTNLRNWVFYPIRMFFISTIPGWAGKLRDFVVSIWQRLVRGLAIEYERLRNWVFNPIRDFFIVKIPGWARTMKDKVQGFFGGMRDGIGRIWDGIKNKTKAPINWVIRNVWNSGILKVWKKITGWIGLGNKLGEIKELAAGGTVGRAVPGMFNKPTAIVGEGNPRYPEYVIPTDPKYATRAKGLWQAAGGHFMADGGILGSIGGAIKGAVSGVTSFLTDPLGSVKKLFKPILGKLGDLGNNPWAKMAGRFPVMAIDGLKGLVGKAAKGLIGNIGGALGLGSSGGSGVQRWSGIVQQALRMLGQPAAYTAITLRRMNQESGGNPTIVNKWDSNWQAGHPSVGLMQVIGPTFKAYAGMLKNTGPFLYGTSVNPLANIYASMRYALSSYGSLPSAYNRAGGYRNGTAGAAGGWHLFGEAGPEMGYSPAGWRILNAQRTAGLGGGGGLHVDRLVLENHGVIGSQHEVEDWLVASLTTLKRKGRLS